MVDNEPVEPKDLEPDVAHMLVDKSPKRVPPIPSIPTSSTWSSLSSWGTVNECDLIARFLHRVCSSAVEISSDVPVMANALAYRLVVVHAPEDEEGSNL